MALKKSVVLQDNFGDDKQFLNCYIKVDSINGSPKEIQIHVGFYRSQNERKIKNSHMSFIPTLDGKNFIAQAYDHLKTLPEFAGATDC